MPKSWIPFRGDDYSKENSKNKKYIPKITSEYARVFGPIVLTGIAIIAAIAIIDNAVTTKSNNSIFALLFILGIVVIAFVAFIDARKINSKKT